MTRRGILVVAASWAVAACGCGPKATTQDDGYRQLAAAVDAAKALGVEAYAWGEVGPMHFGPTFQVDLGLRGRFLMLTRPQFAPGMPPTPPPGAPPTLADQPAIAGPIADAEGG